MAVLRQISGPNTAGRHAVPIPAVRQLDICTGVCWTTLSGRRATTGVECWITAGGAHHTVLSYDVSAEQMKDWARMMDIEFIHITKDTTVDALEKELFLNDLAWKLK